MPSDLRITVFGGCAFFKIHRLEDGILAVLLFDRKRGGLYFPLTLQCSMEESVMFWMSEKEFRATLTPKQLDIYLNCIIGGQSKIDYAAANNMQRQSVYNAATLIMKKAKYFFKKF